MIDERHLLTLLNLWRKQVDERGTHYTQSQWLGRVIEEINTMPTVEANPVVHGEWLEKSMDYVCSQCKTEFHDDIEWIQGEHKLPNFCPECGADMRKEKGQK